MDPEVSAKGDEPCHICDSNIAELFCIICDKKLCKTCVGNHLAVEPEKHKIVKAIDSGITVVLPTCPKHPEERCKNYCQECDLAVCSSCIASDNHERHKFLDILLIFNEKKQVVKNDTIELEQEIRPSCEEILKHVEWNGKKMEEDFENLFSNMEKRRIEWHKIIDFIVNSMKEEVCDFKRKQMKAHTEYLEQMNKILSEIEKSLCLNKGIQNSNEVIKSLSYTSRNQELKIFPPKLEILTPHFVPKPVEIHMISDLVGVIVGLPNNQVKRYQQHTMKGELEENENVSKAFLSYPQTVTCIETKIIGKKTVDSTHDGKLWVSSVEGRIYLLKYESLLLSGPHIHSVVMKELHADYGPKEIAVTKCGELVCGNILSSKINIFKDERKEELINLHKWRLQSFCITAHGGLLVCMMGTRRLECRVVRFDGLKEKQVIQFDCEGRNLFTSGKGKKCVKENRNGDVCVADCESSAVVVTDKAGALRYRYFGEYIGARNRPMRIVTDSMGHIIVSYIKNIHIIDMNGNFLRYLNIAYPGTVVSVDNADYIYLTDTRGTVKKIQYMKFS